MDRRMVIAAAVGVGVLCFAGGAATMRVADSHHWLGLGSGNSGNLAQTDSGFSWPFFGKPRAADAPRAAPPKPAGFAVWQSRTDTSHPDAAACVQMTRPLDASKSYSDFVLVSPDLGHPAAVTVKNDTLCVGGLGLIDHRVTLLKGLPARTGETLASNADVDFTFGEKPPYVGFAGEGVILPREESDGVGIETINVSKLAVEVWRVPDKNLVRKSISAPDPTAEGDYAGDYGDDSPDDEGKIVWKGELAVKGPAGQKAVTVFPLGAVLKEMKPGGYVIKARDASGGRDLKKDDGSLADSTPPAQARRWIMFTDMGLTAYDGSEALDVVVRALKSAQTLGGVRVALVAKNGEDLASATSDSSGRVRFLRPLLKGEGSQAAKMVMAYGPQGDLAVLDLDRSPVDLSNQGVGGRTGAGGDDAQTATAGRTIKTDVDAYLYADRGIYRPGETVHLVAMVRDREAKAVTDRKGVLIIKRPSGVEFLKLPFSRAALGVVSQDIVLPKTAPRGRWTASVSIDGIDDPVGDLSFSVEDFVPQRLAVTLTAQDSVPVIAGQIRRVPVSARFLYGAPGAGLQTQGEVRLRADPNPFPQYKDYHWGDDVTAFDEKVVDLGSTVTDGAGGATLAVDPSQAGDTKIPLTASLTASVFEPGGRPVKESATLKVRPSPLYFGVHVDQGDMSGNSEVAPVSLDVIAVDSSGKRTSATDASWTLISENWNYDWYQQDGKWQWRRSSHDVAVAKGTQSIGPGGSIKINRRLGWGDYRLEVTDPSGAKTVTRFSAGWGAPAKEAEAPDFVRVSPGTRSWSAGDTVDIAIKAPYGGQAQVAVATDRLIDFKTINVPKEGTTVHLKTSAAWGGGAYVLVTVIQPRDPSVTPKPRRALGLVYVPLDPKGQKLTVDVNTPAKIDSKDTVDVPVAVHGLRFGEHAHVTIAAVDEGILRLTKQESPDPVKWYFGKRALTLDYRDDYGRLLDPNLGAPAALNYGGDELGGEGLTVTPIKTVALWSGVVDTGMDGKAVIKLPAADFNGELRIMAVAWTDNAVGSGSKPLTVHQPVVADLDLPRFLAPGDQAWATLELHNLEGKVGGYLAQVFSDRGILSPFKKLYQLALGQRVADHAPLTAPGVAGISNISLHVDGPGFTTVKSYPIETRLGWGAITRTTTELQQPGEAWTPSPQLMQGLAAGSVTMQVSYSPFKGFDPSAVALALDRYPYGCTEQLVSTAYPLLFAAEMSSDPRLKRSTTALNDAVGKLLDRQTLDGAFGLWRVGDGQADAWLGAYATDFLVEAKAQGSPVSDESLSRALGAMRQISRPDGFASISYEMEYPKWWDGDEDKSKAATAKMRSRASAYALYVLAKAGHGYGDLARLRWWHDVQMKNESSPLAMAQVGAGLALMGDRARAHDSIVQAAKVLDYVEPTDWYQSKLRDLAGVIAYAYEAGEVGIARGLQNRLDGAVRDPDSLNTQEQARLLQAAHAMLKQSGPISIGGSGAYALPTAAGSPRWSVGLLAQAHFINTGRGAIWRTVTVRGVPTASPPSQADGVGITKRYWTMTGAPLDLAHIVQGQRVVVLITGESHQGRTEQLAIDDALPAGFEIENALGPDDAQADDPKDASGPYKFLGKLDSPSAQESRDDRYVAALAVPGNGKFQVAYVARAVTPGDFYLPGVELRDMYRPSLYARSGGARTQVKIAGGG